MYPFHQLNLTVLLKQLWHHKNLDYVVKMSVFAVHLIVSGLWAPEVEGNVQPPEEEGDWDDVIAA